MIRRFLWGIVILTVLLLAVAIIWQMSSEKLIHYAFTPSDSYAETPLAPAPDYAEISSWLAHPDIADSTARWTPDGYREGPSPTASVFFVSPTAWISGRSWNSPLDDEATNDRLALFAQMQASTFNNVADIWIPRYRQATLGAFLQPGADADQALDAAYGDVERAFAAFLAAQEPDRPIFIAGHSQGARHILHLLKAHRAEIGDRLVAVYAIGWPVIAPGDSQAIGVPACQQRAESGCLLSWMTFAADGEFDKNLAQMAPTPDLSGEAIGNRAPLCINPLTGDQSEADQEQNLGMLQGEKLVPKKVGARCDANGLLLISPTPKRRGRYILPGGNYHIYDYSLFWANIRADVEARLSAYATRNATEAEAAVVPS